VLSPKDRSLDQCNSLLTILRDYKTDYWLDRRIRCRHLTVQEGLLLGEIPGALHGVRLLAMGA